MRRVNMQSLGITEVYDNTLALLDIKSPKMTLRRVKMVDLFQGFFRSHQRLQHGRKWLFFYPDQARVATCFFPLEQRVLVLALTGADS
jgi:hypothetical protein